MKAFFVFLTAVLFDSSVSADNEWGDVPSILPDRLKGGKKRDLQSGSSMKSRKSSGGSNVAPTMMVTPTAVSGSGSKSKSRSKSNFHSGGDSSSESSASSFSTADLDACVNSAETADYIRLLFELEAKRVAPGIGYSSPIFRGIGPEPINKDFPLPWFANTIPSAFGQSVEGIPDTPGLDPQYKDVGHQKFGGVPFFLLSLVNLDPTTLL